MKVLILEDVIEHQVRLERILDEISKESNIPISYKTTGKVREFEEYIENDEVKGRIIGREGRNIRALEAATGVEIVRR